MNDKRCCGNCRNLHPWAFGFAGGILWAVVIFILAMINAAGGTYGARFIMSISAFYRGYAPTFGGAIIGAIWAFFDAGIGLVIFAWLYNCFVRCCGKKNKTMNVSGQGCCKNK